MDGVSALTSPSAIPSLVTKLSRDIASVQPVIDACDAYYRGQQPLQFLAPEVRQQVGNRLTSLVINWPRVIVDSVQRRTYVEGFRLGAGGQADDELWRIWQANDLDEWSQLAHIDALVHGRSFLTVWGDDEDPATPRITVESAQQMTVSYKAGTRQVDAALKRWRDDGVEYATLYLPDQVTRYAAEAPTASAAAQNLAWRFDQSLPNRLGAVPVVPLVNRPRLLNLNGESELTDIVPLADAVNKLATDMMVTSEFHATKRRWATGIQVSTNGGEVGEAERRRLQAEVAEYWDQATKGKTWLAGSGVNFGQFDEASLENFANAIRLLTSQIAAIGGLPPDDLGLTTTNPASAEARRAADTVRTERAKEKMRSWGGSYERAMRLALAVQSNVPLHALSTDVRGMETIWRDPETPTVAQTADAAVKLLTAGITDVEQAQEDIGLSPVQRESIAARRNQAAATAATADVTARMDLARKLQAEDGLTLNAALAAVGLLQAAAQNSTPTTPPAAPAA
jgi:hypothetical protein